ncbi:MAG: TolB family protein, partial [Rhodothermia bacterium]
LDGTGEVRLGEIAPSERVQGAVWTGDDEILVAVQYGGANGEVFSVPSEGGPVNSRLTLAISNDDYSISDIAWVPGADVVLAATLDLQGLSSVRLLIPSSEQEQRLDAELGAATQSGELLRGLAYAPSGYLFLERVSGISVIALNPVTARPSGKQRSILPDLRGPSVAFGGLVVAHRISSERNVALVLIDPETGIARSVATRDSRLLYPRFDDDGTRLAGVGADGVTITDLVRGDSRRVHGPVAAVSDWLPGRGAILISGYNEGTGADIIQIDPDGSGQPTPLVRSLRSEFYATVSPDQTGMIYYAVDPETGRDLWVADVEVADGRIALTSDPEPWLVGSRDDAVPVWHPSGDWVAYISNQTGEYRVYVRAYPSGGHEVSVSIGTGFDPAWSPDGRRIYYRGEDSIFAVDVLDLALMLLEKPRAVLSLSDRRISVGSQLERSYAVHPVTGELLVSQFVGKRADPSLVFVDNWKALLGEQ